MENPAEAKKGDAALTRGRILAAAQQVFSKQGYSETGIREIANALGLSTTILFRYFGTKAGLFEAALRDFLDNEPIFPPRARFGQFIAKWLADPNLDMGPHAMIVLATGNEEAREIAARLLQELTLTPLARWLGPPDAEARARQIIALCSGFVMYTFQLTVSSGRKDLDRSMVGWLAHSVQAIVDQV
jgi:AcrR family transcriptional regulator